MAVTLLIGHEGASWREWVKANRGNADLVLLDPADPNHGFPARLSRYRADRPVQTRFFGSLDPAKAPHLIIQFLAEAIARADRDLIIQSFAYRPNPILRQTLSLISQLAMPSRILFAEGTPLEGNGFPIGPEVVDLPKSFPVDVQRAQRKAQWLRLREEGHPHAVALGQVAVEGSRIGTGTALSRAQLGELPVPARYAEIAGSSAFLVCEQALADADAARIADAMGVSRLHFANPDAYTDLLCALSRANGEELGMGAVESVDWTSQEFNLYATAIPPARPNILKLGTLKVDRNGNERGENRPWQI